jgi:hypothetical protein
MTLGAMKLRTKAAKLEARSLEAIALLSLSQSKREPIGWMAIDQRGQPWISLQNNAPKSALAWFHTHPPRRGEPAFTPWTRSTDLPKGVFLLSCSE